MYCGVVGKGGDNDAYQEHKDKDNARTEVEEFHCVSEDASYFSPREARNSSTLRGRLGVSLVEIFQGVLLSRPSDSHQSGIGGV